MNVQRLSDRYHVRKLGAEDVEDIYTLCVENPLFYQYHPPVATRESILGDLTALPPGKEPKDKFFVGFYDEDVLLAVMDLILDYPKKQVAYIGFFMMNHAHQGRGIATDIISDSAQYLGECGYQKIRLAIDKGNPQSDAFWTKNHFRKTGEEYPNDDGTAYLPMERRLC